jgi:tetratricopeptide (TPR) repeat protein
MRNWILIIVSLFLFQGNSFAQAEGDAFLTLLDKGKTAFENKDYDTCTSYYEKAEKYQPNNAWLKYAAARCYDLQKEKKKAHQSLTKAIQLDWEDVESWLANSESDFKNLKKKNRCWKKVQKEIKKQQKGMDLTLREELIQMGKDDKKYREEGWTNLREGDFDSLKVNEYKEKQVELDKKNLKRSEAIIAKYGFPSKKLIGKKAATSIFTVIQRADLKYKENYVSLFRKAVKDGDLKIKELAFLLDEIEVWKGRPQIYGTQFHQSKKVADIKFAPIVDEKKVNQRREYIGLPTLESDAQQFGFEYKYKRKKYTEADFKKFTGGWDLVNIRDAETFEITFLPEQNFWVEFLAKGRMRFNRTANICETKYKATDRGRLIFTPNLDCTKKCCDDQKVSQTLNYQDLIEFELYGKVLFLIDTRGKLWEFKRKRYSKQKMNKAN